MDVEGVYRIDPDGKVTRLLTQKEIDKPNGIALSPDEKTLYVIDSDPKVGGNRKIWAFRVADDGSLSKQRLVYDFGKGRGGDGLRVDLKGNLWVAAGINKPRGNAGESLDVPAGVYVISPEGKLLGGFRFRRTSLRTWLRRTGAQDAVRDGGQDGVSVPGTRVGLRRLSAAGAVRSGLCSAVWTSSTGTSNLLNSNT